MKKNAVSWRALAATSVALSIGFGSMAYLALTIGVYVDGYAVNLKQAGMVATVELVAMAVSAWSVVYFSHLFALRTMVFAGSAVAVLGNCLTAPQDTLSAIIMVRILTGLGSGWVAASVNAYIARSPDPVWLLSRSTIVVLVLASLFFVVMPYIYTAYGYPSYFIASGIFLAAGIPLLGWLKEESAGVIAANDAADQPSSIIRSKVVVYLCAIFFLYISYGIINSFSERMGVRLGLDSIDVGAVISFSILLGIPASFLASFVGARTKSIKPLLVGQLVLGVSYLWITFASGYASFAAAISCFGIAYIFCGPFLLREAALMDPSGGVASMVGGVAPMAAALSPVIGGITIEYLGYKSLGVVCFVAILAVMIMSLSFRNRMKSSPAAAHH